MDIHFKTIHNKDILEIIPLLQTLNTTTPIEILKERVLEMSKAPNYECIGAYNNETLIGIAGLWYQTRHYIGKSVEPDHVIIDEKHRGQKIGEQLFKWIETHVKTKDCEAIELNTYTANRKSHKFYTQQNFEIYGFHFLKVIRKNKNFY